MLFELIKNCRVGNKSVDKYYTSIFFMSNLAQTFSLKLVANFLGASLRHGSFYKHLYLMPKNDWNKRLFPSTQMG